MDKGEIKAALIPFYKETDLLFYLIVNFESVLHNLMLDYDYMSIIFIPNYHTSKS